MEIAQLVLEYLKVIPSAPAVGGAVAVTFLSLFRGDISALIRRTGRIRFPGTQFPNPGFQPPPQETRRG